MTTERKPRMRLQSACAKAQLTRQHFESTGRAQIPALLWADPLGLLARGRTWLHVVAQVSPVVLVVLVVLVGSIASTALPARASDSSAALVVTLPREQHLEANAHTSISVLVQVPSPESGEAEMPLMLTPHIEGAAVELVRGRLLRSDGKRVDATHQRFEIPVVARSAGTAILVVHVLTYRCERECKPVRASASAVLEVR